MSYLVRCPSCVQLPDGAIVRCERPKRIDAPNVLISVSIGGAEPNVYAARYYCSQCGVPMCPVQIPGTSIGFAYEEWG